MPSRSSPAPRPVVLRSSIMRRQVMQALLLTGFVVVLLTTLTALVAQSAVERLVRSQLASVASIAEDSLENALTAQRERASLLASSADVKAILAGKADTSALNAILGQVRNREPSLLGVEVRDTN